MLRVYRGPYHEMQGDGLLHCEAEAHAGRQQHPLRPRLHRGRPHERAHLLQLINLRSTRLSGIPSSAKKSAPSA